MSSVNNHDLTNREWDVVELISHGMTNKRIAAKLGITAGTVKMHLHSVYSKLGLSNRTALAIWFLAEATNDD